MTFIYVCIMECVGRDTVVSTATRYGLDNPEIKILCGRHFQHSSKPALSPCSCSGS
jgi:hypothetical protein